MKAYARLEVCARDLICAPEADGLVCSMGATIVLSASQN